MRNAIYNSVIFGLSIALLLSVDKCRLNQKNADANINALNDTLKHFTNKLGTQTTSITTLQLEKSQLKKMVLAQDKELTMLSKPFNRVHNIVKYTQVVKYDTINIFFKDTIPCKFNRLGKVHNKWYAFNYSTNNKGILIDSLTIPNKVTVITGFKRKWFLGKEILETNVTNSNPHVTITSITAAQLVVPVPWYKKWYVAMAIGVASGLVFSK